MVLHCKEVTSLDGFKNPGLVYDWPIEGVAQFCIKVSTVQR